ncbi:MAG: DUF1926 domain-containing protein [Chloroflexi bacterium]|nr:DUF1926 domain-containing protein [Chloroflexota bacterium]
MPKYVITSPNPRLLFERGLLVKSIHLGLAIHNHQPVGNFPWVFEHAYKHSYLPMVEALERHPSVCLALHYTGPLLDWLRQERPDFLPRVAALAQRGQVEIMTGGYFEPILASIPDADKKGQIAKLSRVARDEMAYDPTGLWLAERVWEPHLPKPIAESDVEWTVVDDTHFKLVGLKDEDLFGYYVTEEQGYTLKVFGTSKPLRYLIPWKRVQDVIDYLWSEAAEGGQKIAVMGDDGEKFGCWPGTYEYCWVDGWMEEFFRTLEQSADWLHTVKLGDYARGYPAIGRVYLPTASYAEMMEWALPASAGYEFHELVYDLEAQGREDLVRFMRGGFWRNFLVKYPEVNNMHKKMLRVHDKVYRARALGNGESGLTDLWRGQCNCPYWHGVFGGVYMTDVRTAVFRHLIRAERDADRILRGKRRWLDHSLTDFDGDSLDELLVDGSAQNLYLDPTDGGSIIEWDLRGVAHNLVSTMSRRAEAYHRTLVERAQLAANGGTQEAGDPEVPGELKTIHEIVHAKEKDLDGKICYDWYRRVSLVDHFLHPDSTLEGFERVAYGEMGDFVNQPYRASVQNTKEGLAVQLVRDGHVWVGQNWLPFAIRKELGVPLGREELVARYTVTNSSDHPAEVVFASEWNFNLLGGGHNDQAYCEVPGVTLEDTHFDARGEVPSIGSLRIGNRWLGIDLHLTLSREGRLWRFPIEAVSNSEGGFERTHQGGCTLLSWPLRLDAGQSWDVEMRWVAKTKGSVVEG